MACQHNHSTDPSFADIWEISPSSKERLNKKDRWDSRKTPGHKFSYVISRLICYQQMYHMYNMQISYHSKICN